ncbi:related to Choline kinase [Saccharomycodes ludwigii]|uniref:Related to Choline kinase n=1 Tax=Saccharomycodes ludwigii TaxID=36035 RepID=A0A376B1G0_9ASCO|nr:hypothetical protein SCDLUD_001771 [Saccharomycodes ludwigii]KAH3901983.1 hypothetical protein SCDLUD_001771 [Saccharomycodes ludwigii]SSD58481.1 related to Choline kinase [Saccharomycodes ludwigii]
MSLSISSPSIEKNSRIKERSNSSGSNRRPSIPRRRSSNRLIRTISFEDESLEDQDKNVKEKSQQEQVEKLPNSSNLSATSSITTTTNTTNNHEDNALNERQDPSSSSADALLIPFVNSSLDHTLPISYFKQDIINIISALKISKWKRHIDDINNNQNNLKVRSITGAMTNSIFKVTYKGLPSLLLRIYGPNADNIIDREYELKVLARLSMQNIGPQLYGCFNNGRIEQFLESTTLTREQIREWKTSQRIARRMKELHYYIKLNKSEIEGGSISWKKLENWVTQIGKSKWSTNPENVKSVFTMVDNWNDFTRIIQKYKKYLVENDPFYNKLCFCHNDAQYGNLLFTSPIIQPGDTITPVTSSGSLLTSTSSSTSLFPTSSNINVEDIINPPLAERTQDSKLVVIDFEYGGANPPTYDLANHLSEWMHNYHCKDSWEASPEKYPNKDQVLNFLYSYVSDRKYTGGVGSEYFDEAFNKKVIELYNSIIRWRPCVQLFWALWAVIQSNELASYEQKFNKSDTKANLVEEDAPGGEKYIISYEEDDSVSNDGKEGTQSKNSNDDNNDATSINSVNSTDSTGNHEDCGVDLDSFASIKYARCKMDIFWGDIIDLGIVDVNDTSSGLCTKDTSTVKHLDTVFLRKSTV